MNIKEAKEQIKNAMTADNSWDKSAQEYIDLYKRTVN